MISTLSSNEENEMHQERNENKVRLHDCLKWTLFIGKCSGFIPLSGFGSHRHIRFTWKSAYMFIWFLTFLIQCFMLLLRLICAVRFGLEGNQIHTLIYVGCCFIITLLMFRFSKRYENFMFNIESVENVLPRMKKPRSIMKFVNVLAGAMVVLGVFDRISYHVYSFYIKNNCYGGPELYWKYYFKNSYQWYFEIFPFSYIPVIIFEVIILQFSVIRVYGDVLIMSTCIYLKSRFEEFNRLIFDKEYIMFNKNFKPSWAELQVYYTRLSKLVAIVDENINSVVFFSYTSNIYFICVYLYLILNQLTITNNVEPIDCIEQYSKDLIPVLRRVFTVGFLVIRTCLVSHLAAEVNVASRMPLMVLHTVPSANYDSNMRRLMSQVYYSKVGISGLNFFQITRGMILAMIAKILTYEIVLVQV